MTQNNVFLFAIASRARDTAKRWRGQTIHKWISKEKPKRRQLTIPLNCRAELARHRELMAINCSSSNNNCINTKMRATQPKPMPQYNIQLATAVVPNFSNRMPATKVRTITMEMDRPLQQVEQLIQLPVSITTIKVASKCIKTNTITMTDKAASSRNNNMQWAMLNR